MGGSVGSAPTCFGNTLGSNPDIFKNPKWAKEWPTHSKPNKKKANLLNVSTDDYIKRKFFMKNFLKVEFVEKSAKTLGRASG
jgi:hypothetical protein